MYGNQESLYTEKKNSAEQYPTIKLDLVYHFDKLRNMAREVKTNDRFF
jgi:hypothetical protein